jgi:hypothetical protein
MVSSDCLKVVKLMKEKNLCFYSAILKEIEIRSNFFEFVSFQHEDRECNEEGHLVARNSISASF